MNIRPVKTEGDYAAALERIEALWGSEPGTPRGDELDVLTTLVGVYEDEHHPVPPPSPIEAITFVMDQRGLKQADLVPYLGSRSKVSEVLNGKRPLTLSMIRALHAGLGIPAWILIRKGQPLPEGGADIAWDKFPVHEVVSLGWVENRDPRTEQEEIMRDLIAQAQAEEVFDRVVCFRQGGRRNVKDDPYVIQAWILKIMAEARKIDLPVKYRQEEIDQAFVRRVAQLSIFVDGPIKAREYLLSKGIKLVFAPHLKRTYVDGVVLLEDGTTPVIGMSLRYDRLDYFWFTLIHELSHIALKHISSAGECIVEDLELHSALDELEKETDQLAMNALIPNGLWQESSAKRTAKLAHVIDLARKADVHPAIVAGRVRHEKGNYRLLSRHVGHGKVKCLFFE